MDYLPGSQLKFSNKTINDYTANCLHRGYSPLHYPTGDLQRRPRPDGAGSYYLYCELNDLMQKKIPAQQ